MQTTILYIYFFTTFPCGFAQEKSVPDSEDNIFLAADVKELSSTEEKQVRNNEDDDNTFVDVEEILRELSAERAKNRDLNETISDILDRLAEMEDAVVTVGERVEINSASIRTLSTRGTWCGFQSSWTTSGIISYENLTFSDSNVYFTEQPLDIKTGNRQCYVLTPEYYLIFVAFQGSSLCRCLESGE